MAGRVAPLTVKALEPLTVMVVMTVLAVPVLETVRLCVLVLPAAMLLKARVEATCRVPMGAGAPVPLRVTDCGLAGALSAKVMAPLRLPVAVGAKLTATVQLAPAARLAGQLLL